MSSRPFAEPFSSERGAHQHEDACTPSEPRAHDQPEARRVCSAGAFRLRDVALARLPFEQVVGLNQAGLRQPDQQTPCVLPNRALAS